MAIWEASISNTAKWPCTKSMKCLWQSSHEVDTTSSYFVLLYPSFLKLVHLQKCLSTHKGWCRSDYYLFFFFMVCSEEKHRRRLSKNCEDKSDVPKPWRKRERFVLMSMWRMRNYVWAEQHDKRSSIPICRRWYWEHLQAWLEIEMGLEWFAPYI